MHVEFKRIHLHNFLSFGDAELAFNDDGFIKVSGINENPDDNAGSNGSGKSSLWEGIIWVITGDTIRGTKQVVNLYGDDGCYVEIEFILDNKHYKLIRSKEHKVYKTNLQIFIDETDMSGKGLRDSSELLQQYIPDLTASLLGSVIILGQGLPQKFTNNTPSGRKVVLEQLSKSDFMIEDLKKRVSDRKSELQENIRTLDDIILQNKTKEKLLIQQIKDNEEQLAVLTTEDIQLNIQHTTDDLKRLKDELLNVQSEVDSSTELLNQVNIELKECGHKKTEQLYYLKDTYEEIIQPDVDRYNQLLAESNSIKKQISNIRSIKDVCPTCGQKLPDVHKPDTTMLELDLENIESKLLEVKSILTEQEKIYTDNCQKVVLEFATLIDNLTDTQKKLTTEVNTHTTTKQKLEKEYSSMLEYLQQLEVKSAQLQGIIHNCNKIIRENNETLAVLNEEFLYNNKQRDLAQSHVEVISKFDTALKRDFRGYLLSTVIDYIETRAKQYSEVIFDTSNIKFCLDGNNIDISYMNKAYENLSGGEKQKIDLIIQFSIRDMLSAQLNFTSNLLVLDEVFDGLDMLGCNRVIELIQHLPDVSNVFIVTHRQDLSIPNDTELIVAKSSAGISEIRV